MWGQYAGCLVEGFEGCGHWVRWVWNSGCKGWQYRVPCNKYSPKLLLLRNISYLKIRFISRWISLLLGKAWRSVKHWYLTGSLLTGAPATVSRCRPSCLEQDEMGPFCIPCAISEVLGGSPNIYYRFSVPLALYQWHSCMLIPIWPIQS